MARRYDGVLRRASLEEMWRPVVPLVAGAGLDEGFGEQSGFRSCFYLDPASTTAVIGVLNTTNEARPEFPQRGWEMVTRRAVALVGP